MTMNDKKGTAVVTGASAGIGKIYARRLAKRGYDLVLVARRENLLDEVASSVRAEFGVKVQTLVADLAIAADLDNVENLFASDDSITLLVNNAGTSTLGSLTAVKQSEVDAMTGLNIGALVRLSLAALRKFNEKDSGTIINIGSVLGFHTLPISSIYSGTKGFVNNFTRGLQDEVAGTNVKVQLVLPAATATDIWELSGVPLSALDPTSVMEAEQMVDAALAGLDQGETITLPSVEDVQLFADYDAARLKLLEASQNGKSASRYLSAR
ncbi:short-subunit dehydrogenase [Phyllobacterium sp. 1468]|uniref:SDR family NAD(P)-dependent oxidoreductase n=1 Tax=Phyllobacterium sp. 1468 TaxID=2817759 RepID=UPI002863517A|nr:SDR family NAD(P)-dependent oxidoreductase [Phyllobacterium sp. 1468]MDR6632636.1 short-subunit dehydrogenase [Phyllobacterium sp. 1468]